MASQSYISIWVHYVWATKNKEPLIKRSVKPMLYDKIREISQKKKYHLDFINGVEDHIHLLFSLNSSTKICDIPKQIKGISSKWANENGLIDGYFDWQDGYGAFSVSPYNLAKVRNYIKNQETHHQKLSFDKELKWLKHQAKKYERKW